MQNPMIDITDREPGNNEGPGVLHAIGSSELLNELWPGLVDDDEPMYPCFGCGESVAADDCYSTSDEMDALCEDCHCYGRERNEAAIREPFEY